MIISDPEEIKQIFRAPPTCCTRARARACSSRCSVPNSVILLDEAPHLRQRKLLLPAFHGEQMQRLSGLMRELAEREVASWPLERADRAAPAPAAADARGDPARRVRLRARRALDELRDLLTEILAFGESPLSLMPPAQRLLAGRGPVGRLERVGARADELIYGLIDERRAARRATATTCSRCCSARATRRASR